MAVISYSGYIWQWLYPMAVIWYVIGAEAHTNKTLHNSLCYQVRNELWVGTFMKTMYNMCQIKCAKKDWFNWSKIWRGVHTHPAGNKNNFLGMNIRFIGNIKLFIRKSQHIQEDYNGFGETWIDKCVKILMSKLFKIMEEAMFLTIKRRIIPFNFCYFFINNAKFKSRLWEYGLFLI